MLDVLGLSEDEELAYRHLVGTPSGSASELAAAVGLDRLDAPRVLSSLETRGLVARASSDRERFVASPPSVALGAMLVQRQEELCRAQVAMAELAGVYRGTVARRDVADVVDVVHGPEAIAQRFAQLQYSARTSIHSLVRHDAAVVTREENDEAERAALTRGVRFSVVLERSAFEEPGFYGAAAEALGLGMELRIVASVPVRVIIVDRELALVPMTPHDDRDPVRDALLVHPSGLLDALLALFGFVWQSATRIVPADARAEGDGDRLGPLDTKVLTLLLAGLTDATIGAQLGLSLRTVQRRVRQMMDRLQVDTRLQLGYQAAHRGWI